MRRGIIVEARVSSTESIRTLRGLRQTSSLGFGGLGSGGIFHPRLTRAAMSNDIWLLPVLVFPSKRDISPRGKYPSHSHKGDLGTMSAALWTSPFILNGWNVARRSRALTTSPASRSNSSSACNFFSCTSWKYSSAKTSRGSGSISSAPCSYRRFNSWIVISISFVVASSSLRSSRFSVHVL